MTTPTHYRTLGGDAEAVFKDKGSRFLAFAFAITDEDAFKARLAQLQEQHPKAVHYCYAWRLGASGSHYRAHDDGEPSGSAGRPILGQIDTKQLTDSGVIVVRYFGGTLLGVPGLIRAYKTAAAEALSLAPIVEKEITQVLHIRCDYTDINSVLYHLRQAGAHTLAQDMGLDCRLQVAVPLARLSGCLKALEPLHRVEVKTE